MYGYAIPDPSQWGADSLVAYNTLRNVFDNVSATFDINEIYASALGDSLNKGVVLNLVGGQYGTGHAVELNRTKFENGKKMFYIIDAQNNTAGWKTLDQIEQNINSAFIIGEQDNYNQSTAFFGSYPQDNPTYEWIEVFDDSDGGMYTTNPNGKWGYWLIP